VKAHLTQLLQSNHKQNQQIANAEMTYTRPNIQPTPLILHQIKEIQRQYIRNRKDNHKQ
jgi:hypothetical protein